MNDDTLPAVWMADPPIQKETVLTAINAVLDEDRACRGKERSIRVASVLALALLCPALLWCAAYGITPLVRGGYALMARAVAERLDPALRRELPQHGPQDLHELPAGDHDEHDQQQDRHDDERVGNTCRYSADSTATDFVHVCTSPTDRYPK
jgi:hypothetical protein